MDIYRKKFANKCILPTLQKLAATPRGFLPAPPTLFPTVIQMVGNKSENSGGISWKSVKHFTSTIQLQISIKPKQPGISNFCWLVFNFIFFSVWILDEFFLTWIRVPRKQTVCFTTGHNKG